MRRRPSRRRLVLGGGLAVVLVVCVARSPRRASESVRRGLSESDDELYPCEDLTHSDSCYGGGERVFEIETQACRTCGFSSTPAMVCHWYDCVSCHEGAVIVPLDDDCSGACVLENSAVAFSALFGGAVLAESACSRFRACYDEDDAQIGAGNDVFPVAVPRSEWPAEWAALASNETDDDDAMEPDEPSNDGYDDDYLDWLVLPAELEWYENWDVTADDGALPDHQHDSTDASNRVGNVAQTAYAFFIAAMARLGRAAEALQSAINAPAALGI
mmetsp:Transcript_15667/g.49035  ORF Transcript_15667/g.49035 Transcript_15667/m.49035 type:complete len:273 (+) Transcript_15667:212-1030(+)